MSNNRNRLFANLSLITLIACIFMAIVGALGSKFDWWHFSTAFSILKWSVYLLAVPVLLVLIATVFRIKDKQPIIFWQQILVSLVLLSFAFFMHSQRQAFKELPTVGDITTDFVNPPMFSSLIEIREATATAPLEYRGEEATQLQKNHFADIQPLIVEHTVEEAMDKSKALLEDLGFFDISSDSAKGIVEGTESTFWFGFEDDVVIRISALENGKSRIDIRSALRVGYLDAGANGKRVQRIIAGLSQ